MTDTAPGGGAGTGTVFRETTAEPRTQAVPLAHLSLELGHLYMEDFEAGPERLHRHFAQVRPWADAARAAAAASGRGAPRISTCFLIDDYFTRLSSPAELIPTLLAEAERAGLSIDYLARESACASADGIALADSVLHRLVESPHPGDDGSRPPAKETGWLTNGERTPGLERLEAMANVAAWRPPAETAARRHSVFLDVEMWDEDDDGRRTWSCAFLAAVWQLARLGLLRHCGEPVLRPTAWSGDGFPRDWGDLPALLQLDPTAAPFAAYRTRSVLPARFLSVEHAVGVVLAHFEADKSALRQIAERSRGEGLPVPGDIPDRATYAFYEAP